MMIVPELLSPMMACLKKIFNGEIIWHLKRRLKRLSLKMKGLVHFFIHQLFYLRGVQNIAVYRVAILWKGTNWKFIFLWRKIKWYGLQIAKRHFSYSIWLMISEKSVMVYTFLHHAAWWCAHVPKVSANKAYRKNCLLEFPIAWTHIYIQKERTSKHFGKKIIQLVWAVVTCLILNMELNMILIVLMEFACIRQSVGL